MIKFRICDKESRGRIMEEYEIENMEDYEIIVSLIMDYILDNYINYEIKEVRGIRKFLLSLEMDVLLKIAKMMNINIENKEEK